MKKSSFLGSDHLIGEIVLNLNALSASSKVVEKTLTLISHNSSHPVAEITAEMQLILPGVAVVAENLADQIGAVLKDAGDQANGVNPSRLTSNFKRFLVGVTPIVKAHSLLRDIYTWKSAPVSILACLTILIFNHFKDWTLFGCVIAIYLYMTMSPQKRELKVKPDLGLNLLFIQETMGQFSNIVEFLQQASQSELSEQWTECLKYSVMPCFVLCVCIPFLDLLLYSFAASILFSHATIRYTVIVHSLRLLTFITPANKRVEDPQTSLKTRVYRVYENQRLWLSKWTNCTLPHERSNWSDINGDPFDRDSVKLPEGFEWSDVWHFEGDWEYAFDFNKSFHAQPGFFDYVRRRCWVRTAEGSF